MNIIVFDVPAENGGALTILNQYYNFAKRDKENNYIFVLSIPVFIETENIKVINFKWIKKSWFHRLYFDTFVAHKLVRRYNANKIITLQNILIKKTDVSQVLYLQQSLPFSEKKFTFLEAPKLWMYQNIISIFIIKSLKNAQKIIVQSNWIKDVIIKEYKVSSECISVELPVATSEKYDLYYEDNSKETIFFYPANAEKYKNHKIIIDAIKLIVNENKYKEFKVILTVTGNENKTMKKLYKEVIVNNLPVLFLGNLNKLDVYKMYSKSILLFPSYIETFGLPLMEARQSQTPIIASDTLFSHEVLNGYKKAYFFDHFSSEVLKNKLCIFLENKI